MADDQTTAAPSLDLSALTPEMINGLFARATQPLPNIQPDQTPVDHSGFWGGLRHGISLLGEFAGSPGPETLKTLSPAEREQAGFQALSRFGTGLMAASHYVPGQTFGSNLAQGFQAAEHGYDTTARQAAGLLGAQQAYAIQNQQGDLAKLKEVLPLLQLKAQTQAADVARRIAAGGVAPPNVGDVGADTYVGAIGGHEGTGQNPRSSAAGVGQFLDSTWNDFATANPQYFAGMSPDQILAAKKDPAFGAKVGPIAIEWLAKQNADELQRKGVTPSGPLLGIAHYLGAGAAGAIAGAPDNAPISAYVVPAAVKSNPELANMTVGQMKARYANTPPPSFMKPAVAPGQASAPGAGAGAGARPALPPPEAPIAPGAGGTQTAGPAAPTGSVIPPSPPGSAADVEAIKAGMIGAGADPTTLAPGSGSTPAPMPGAVVTAQATPPIVSPYGPDWKPTEIPIPNLPRYDPNLTPAQNASFDRQRQEAGLGLPGEVPAKLAAVEKARADAIAAKQKDAADAADVFRKEQAESQRGIAQHLWDQQQKQDDAKQKLANDIALEQERGSQSRLSTAAGAVVESNKIVRDMLAKDSVTAAGKVQNLEGLLALSDNVGDKNTTLQSLANVKYGGTSLLNHLANFGIVPKGDAGPIQMLQSGISGAITELRSGIQMGQLSDRDLTFIESMGPSLYEDQATRTAVIKYLQQAARAKMKLNTIYNEEMTRPNTSSADALERARDIMEKKYPIVPQMPADLYAHRRDPNPEWSGKVAEWADNYNVKSRTLYRAPGGGLKLVPDPQAPGGE
jgi:hypothetical protein